MDYREYKMDILFWFSVILISVGISGVTGYLFYDAWWGIWPVVPMTPIVYKMMRASCIKKQSAQLKTEFCEVMTLLSGDLNAGYSLETAFIQVQRKNGTAFPLMNPELIILVNGIACQRRVEVMLKDLAKRSGMEEIMEFSNMIEMAKRYGGNIPNLIRQLTSNMQDKKLVEMEIQTVVAAKRLEGRIMLLVPFGIVLFLRLTTPAYISVFYNTAAGRIWMTVTLFVIGICVCWIEKIVRIEV